jgi:hypothetical protein
VAEGERERRTERKEKREQRSEKEREKTITTRTVLKRMWDEK